jgi:hypothetical protein
MHMQNSPQFPVQFFEMSETEEPLLALDSPSWRTPIGQGGFAQQRSAYPLEEQQPNSFWKNPAEFAPGEFDPLVLFDPDDFTQANGIHPSFNWPIPTQEPADLSPFHFGDSSNSPAGYSPIGQFGEFFAANNDSNTLNHGQCSDMGTSHNSYYPAESHQNQEFMAAHQLLNIHDDAMRANHESHVVAAPSNEEARSASQHEHLSYQAESSAFASGYPEHRRPTSPPPAIAQHRMQGPNTPVPANEDEEGESAHRAPSLPQRPNFVNPWPDSELFFESPADALQALKDLGPDWMPPANDKTLPTNDDDRKKDAAVLFAAVKNLYGKRDLEVPKGQHLNRWGRYKKEDGSFIPYYDDNAVEMRCYEVQVCFSFPLVRCFQCAKHVLDADGAPSH